MKTSRCIALLAGLCLAGQPVSISGLSQAAAASPSGSVNLCGLWGYSGKPANAVSCVNGEGRRTITCAAGYYAAPPFSPSVTLIGATPFAGCNPINMCAVYGYSGATAHTLSCTSGIGSRTITCAAGYYATPPATPSITLSGSTAFTGCHQIDMCALYGFSGHNAGAQSCTNGINTRTIVCEPSYHVDGTEKEKEITLTGSTPFVGCVKNGKHEGR
jgi:hypothetical protein